MMKVRFRESNIELMRIVLMTMIILLHITLIYTIVQFHLIELLKQFFFSSIQAA